MKRKRWFPVLILAVCGACPPAEEDFQGQFAEDFDAREQAIEIPEFGGALWKRQMVWARRSELHSAYEDAESEYREALRLGETSLERAATHAALGNLAVRKLHHPLFEPFQTGSGLNPSRNPRQQIERHYRNAVAEARKSQENGQAREEGVAIEIEAANNLSVLLIDWERYPAAVELLAGALNRVPPESSSIYLYNYALALHGSERRPEAVDQLLRAASTERETQTAIRIAWDWLRAEPEFQSSERLQRLLNVALEKGVTEIAQWVIGEKLAVFRNSGAPLTAGLLTDLAHYFHLTESSSSELRERWIPEIQALAMDPAADDLWEELTGMILLSLPEHGSASGCGSLFKSWAEEGGESTAIFGELLRHAATREYRSSRNRQALCLYQRLWSWPTGETTDVQYPLALLAAEGDELDPTGRWLDSIAEELTGIQEPGLDLLAGEAYLARHQWTGQSADLQLALTSWEKGLGAKPEPMLAARLHERRGMVWLELSQPKDAAREMLQAAELLQDLRPDWEKKKAQEVAELMRRAIAIRPDDREAQALLQAAHDRIEGRLEETRNSDALEEEWTEATEEAMEESDG